MTSKEFIFQGLTTRSHSAVLSEVFAVPELSNGWLSVAFVTSNGVEMARPVLSAHAERTTVYAGIRNGITSVQGMKGLLQLGLKLYVVDTGRATLVFTQRFMLPQARRVPGCWSDRPTSRQGAYRTTLRPAYL